MQNKGLITVFATLFGLISLYVLSYTFITNKVEKEAKEYVKTIYPASEQTKERAAAEVDYLDSIAPQKQFLGITYKSAKPRELKKGLDLKGGVNAIIQISVKDILKDLANNTKDAAFNQALKEADILQNSSQDTYLDSFLKAFEALPGENKLASPEIFYNRDLEGARGFNSSSTNAEVGRILKNKIDDAVDSAFEVLRKRTDRFGVTQPNIQRLGESGRILIELPGERDVQRVVDLVTKKAQLQFWDVSNDKVGGFLFQADQKLAELMKDEKAEAEVVEDSTEGDTTENLLGGEEVEEEDTSMSNPLLSLRITDTEAYPSNSGMMVFKLKDTAVVNGYLKKKEIRDLLPKELRYTKFVWGKPENKEKLEGKVTGLYALAGNKEDKAELSGGVIVDAEQSYNQSNEVAVTMQMNGTGAKIWKEMTDRANKNRNQIAIVLDDIVYSAPGVSVVGGIGGGRSEITGNFTVLEAKDLANVLQAGKLPASADIIQAEVVGPTLGQEAINSGVLSFLIALVIVLLWMIFYYGKAGIFADIALIVNILFIFGVLASIGAVLTLPGIAGIVLTIGISVDANVLIFERIREELAKGKSQRDSINDGFRNALSSILDANITTGLTGLILLVFGTGPIKGFATTLLIGIGTSLFTAIFITRLFVDSYTKNGKTLTCSTPLTKNFLKNINIDFLGKRKVAYIISGVLILVSLSSLFTNGLNQGIDFVGGRTYTVRFDKDVDANAVETDLIAEYGSAEAKTYGGDNQLKITTKYKVDETGTEVDLEIEQKLYNALKPNLPSGMTYDDFIRDDENKVAGRMGYYKVSPTIADDIKTSSLWAVLGSLVVVFLYILLRFRRWQFSLGAVAAVFHDVLLVLGIFSLTYKIMPFSMEIDQSFIAAILTVIGYSLNDTVVVFDRIREFFNEHENWRMSKIINSALNSTLSRTLNTSMTTLVVLLTIFFLGAESIRGLIFALIVGVVVGTYSSLFIATPVFYDTVKKRGIDLSEKKEEEEEEA